MRIGVIGVGRIGRFHAETLCGHAGVDSVVICDEDAARAFTVSQELGATTAARDAILRQVDGVVIATPTNTHAELVEEAVLAGVPVFCEKPIALDLPTTRRVAALVHERDAIVQMGFQRRFDAGYRAARDARQSGALGRVYSVRIAGHDPAPPHEAYLPGSGGIFRDLHIHDFDIVPWVLGAAITEVYADGSVLVDDMFARHDDIDTAISTLRFADGTLGVLTGGRHNPLGYDIRLEIFGSRDSVTVGWDAHTPMHSLEPNMPAAPVAPYAMFLDRFAAAYRAELEAFVDVVAGSIATPCHIDDAEQSLLVALACDRSRRERRPVRIDELRSVPQLR
ncbi:MAG: Gfo/Idh/MocA family oxidoreductase [Gemmatimonadaceae bacterium]|nr:Gfo/Idh/MocA family oxidoreductase [Gemmatimonadaceae bacterium]